MDFKNGLKISTDSLVNSSNNSFNNNKIDNLVERNNAVSLFSYRMFFTRMINLVRRFLRGLGLWLCLRLLERRLGRQSINLIITPLRLYQLQLRLQVIKLPPINCLVLIYVNLRHSHQVTLIIYQSPVMRNLGEVIVLI